MSERPLPRLFCDHDLCAGISFPLPAEAAHYLTRVLRLSDGDSFLVFNGREGEWRARVLSKGKKAGALVDQQVQSQPPPLSLLYAFAPIKAGRLDYISQKAVEMGAGHIQPVITERTIVRHLNLKRIEKNLIEATEQCGLLSIPTLSAPLALNDFLDERDHDSPLIFCDELAKPESPVARLRKLKKSTIHLLVGPEGGFTPDERNRLLANPSVLPISLGPRILRADTASVAAMALIEACCD